MTYLLVTVIWIFSVVFIWCFIKGAYNGCTGSCMQGRRKCDCKYGEK